MGSQSWAWGPGGGADWQGARETSRVLELFFILVVVIAAWVCVTLTKHYVYNAQLPPDPRYCLRVAQG